MTPGEIEIRLRATRPEPPPGLRGRVLAAAAGVERRPPWWARVSTWSAAAALLLVGNWRLMADGPAPAPRPEPARPLMALSPAEAAGLPPILVACLQRPPAPMRGQAPTPRTPLEEILR